MSDVPQGPGWWQASDGKWYAPEQFPSPAADAPPPFPQQLPQQPYGTPYPGYTAAPRTENLAIASLVCSLAGTVLLLLCGIGIVGTIAAIPFGIAARRRIAQSGGQLTGDGMALAGLIVGIAMTALAVIGWTLWFVLVVNSSS